MAIEQAEAWLVATRGRKDVEDDEKKGGREEEVKEKTKRKRRASRELIPAKPTLETPTATSTKTSADPNAPFENIRPDILKDSGANAHGEEEAVHPVKAEMP